MSVVLNFVFPFFIPCILSLHESEQAVLRNFLFVLISRKTFMHAMYVAFIGISVTYCRNLEVKFDSLLIHPLKHLQIHM